MYLPYLCIPAKDTGILTHHAGIIKKAIDHGQQEFIRTAPMFVIYNQ